MGTLPRAKPTRGGLTEALAQGDEGENPEEIENPGEHRAPGGLNRRLVATDSQGEKGPEDEPLSRNATQPCREHVPGASPERGMAGGPVWKRDTGLRVGGPQKDRKKDI
jgi:hypothetical protein